MWVDKGVVFACFACSEAAKWCALCGVQPPPVFRLRTGASGVNIVGSLVKVTKTMFLNSVNFNTTT